MLHHIACRTTLLFLMLIVCCPLCVAQSPLGHSDLLEQFVEPPKAAQPSTYWLWLNGYANREQIRQELQQYRDVGISGVCIFDMGARGIEEYMPPTGPAFMSEQSVEDIAYAVRVAKELDINVQLSVASSWDMGGSWVKPEHVSMPTSKSSSAGIEADSSMAWCRESE